MAETRNSRLRAKLDAETRRNVRRYWDNKATETAMRKSEKATLTALTAAAMVHYEALNHETGARWADLPMAMKTVLVQTMAAAVAEFTARLEGAEVGQVRHH
jgi:hypothetical protein